MGAALECRGGLATSRNGAAGALVSGQGAMLRVGGDAKIESNAGPGIRVLDLAVVHGSRG